MSETKKCTECQTVESAKFCSLKGEKWKEVENNNLAKVIWNKGILLCNICYMCFVENPLKKGRKRVKTMDEQVIGKNITTKEVNMKVDFTGAIKAMAKILYDREHSKKEKSIYSFDEMRRIFQE